MDYPSTTNYYWPHISKNATQESKTGLDSWEEEKVKGPFGFNAATKLNGEQVKDPSFATINQEFVLRIFVIATK